MHKGGETVGMMDAGTASALLFFVAPRYLLIVKIFAHFQQQLSLFSLGAQHPKQIPIRDENDQNSF